MKVKAKDLPCQLDVLAARLRLAKIPFRVHASNTGFGIEIKRTKRRDYNADLARSWAIWDGTKEVRDAN